MKQIQVRKLRWRLFELHLSELFESSCGVIKSHAVDILVLKSMLIGGILEMVATAPWQEIIYG